MNPKTNPWKLLKYKHAPNCLWFVDISFKLGPPERKPARRPRRRPKRKERPVEDYLAIIGSSEDHPRGSSDFPRGSSDYPRGFSDYPRGSSDYPRGLSDYPRGSPDYPDYISSPQRRKGRPLRRGWSKQEIPRGWW